MTTGLLRNGLIVDTRSMEVTGACDIRVEDSRIVEVAPALKVSKTDWCIDLHGRYACPGLIDAHVHGMAFTTDMNELARARRTLVTARAGAAFRDMLDRGFTTVRDAGGADWGLAESIRRGYFRGPRLYTSGRALAQTGGQGDFRQLREEEPSESWTSGRSIARVVDGVSSVRRAVREEIANGADQIKVMVGPSIGSSEPYDRAYFADDELTCMVSEASVAGKYVMAHAYANDTVLRAIKAGVRTIEHGNFIDEMAANSIKANSAFLVPTLSVYNAYYKFRTELGLTDAQARRVKDALEAGMRSLEIGRSVGVSIGFGTDLEGPYRSFQLGEIPLRSEVLSSSDILASATRIGAEILGMAGTLGVIAPDAFADIIAMDFNPLEHLNRMADDGYVLPAIIKDGKPVRDLTSSVK